MKINVGIREDGKEIIFVSNEAGENVGELEISKEYYEASLKELGED